VREHHSETITRFVWGLRPKIRHAMITDSYDLGTIEETFDVALKIDDFQHVSQCQDLVFYV